MIEMLAPIFMGRWASYAEALVLDIGPSPRPSLDEMLADEAFLARMLRRHADFLGCADLRPAASIWMLRYCELLLPPVVAGATLLMQEFPVASVSLSVELDENAAPRLFHIPHLGRSLPGVSVHARYETLVWEHLSPVVEALVVRAPVARKLLWANVARTMDAIFDVLTEHAPGPAPALDREALLHVRTWPGRDRNPLHGEVRSGMRLREGRPTFVPLHRQCCLYFHAPPHLYCGACPIAPEKRRSPCREGE
jgi:ferric iron reductase protein FhuF